MWGCTGAIHGAAGSYLNQIRLQAFPNLAECDGSEGGLICFPLFLTKGKATRGPGLSWQASRAPHGSATRGTWPGKRSLQGESPPLLSSAAGSVDRPRSELAARECLLLSRSLWALRHCCGWVTSEVIISTRGIFLSWPHPLWSCSCHCVTGDSGVITICPPPAAPCRRQPAVSG